MSVEPVFKRVGYPTYRELYGLFSRSREDPAIQEEFRNTFDGYLTPHMTKCRVIDMYENGPPERIGEMVYPALQSTARGLGWLALTKELLPTPRGGTFEGANFSMFIEDGYRRQGLGAEMLLKLMEDFVQAQERSEHWRQRTPWTGIRSENTASVALFEYFGFKRTCPLPRAPEYDIYTY